LVAAAKDKYYARVLQNLQKQFCTQEIVPKVEHFKATNYFNTNPSIIVVIMLEKVRAEQLFAFIAWS